MKKFFKVEFDEHTDGFIVAMISQGLSLVERVGLMQMGIQSLLEKDTVESVNKDEVKALKSNK
jgi:hypothetical protein